MDYYLLKTVHIISASILFGGGLTLFIYQLVINRHHVLKKRLQISHCLLKLQTALLIPAGMTQLVTGFMMINLKHYDLHAFWVLGAIIGFILAVGSYLSSIYSFKLAINELEKTIVDTSFYEKNHKKYLQRAWLTFGLLAMMVFFMSTGPQGLTL